MPTCVSSPLSRIHSLSLCVFVFCVFVHQIVCFAHELAQNIIQSDSIIILPFLCWFVSPSIRLLHSQFRDGSPFWLIFLFANIVVGFWFYCKKKFRFYRQNASAEGNVCVQYLVISIIARQSLQFVDSISWHAKKKHWYRKKRTSKYSAGIICLYVIYIFDQMRAILSSSRIICFSVFTESKKTVFDSSNSYPQSVCKVVSLCRNLINLLEFVSVNSADQTGGTLFTKGSPFRFFFGYII